ncbi:hypothetical protein VCB98_07000 [Gammaproteobacteria bacterium AB-CW1]|uniref:Uncharacterized protein n=1 Tax=Natronospira elongata TaxID=3110268 RepID=A0AAP6JFB5_9GAMM|nr:hypothetical protein [Gammaproteobacteria bacterium AB-CW1]
MRILFTIIMTLCGSIALADSPKHVLGENSLGPWKFSEDPVVSREILKEHFPDHTIIYDVGQGDSPDFHYFEVKSVSGDVLFSVRSYSNWEDGPLEPEPDAEVPLHLLEVRSPKIADSHEIRVGDRVSDIIDARGDGLAFGPRHFHVYMGDGNIYYNLVVESESESGIQRSPEGIERAEAIEGDWKVVSISWPGPAWD